MKKLLLVLLLVMLPSMSFAGWNPSEDQMFIMDVARVEGNHIGWPETIQAIQYVESKCGKYIHGPKDKNFSNRYFGSGQMKISTVRWIIKSLWKVKNTYSDEQIMVRLLVNDVWAIQLSTDYFEYLLHKFRNYPEPWKHAVLAYNRGPGTVMKRGLSHDPYNYVANVSKAIRTVVRPYNKQVRTIYPQKTKRTPPGIRLVNGTYTNLY